MATYIETEILHISCGDDGAKWSNVDKFVLQGIWCSHRSDLDSQHVHSVRCSSPLRLCHFCQDITRTGGGK